MTVFYVFITVVLVLLAMGVGLYCVIPWLMERDSLIESEEEWKPDYKYTFNNETGDVERVVVRFKKNSTR